MSTKEGFDLLQLVADNAMDWHDNIATGGEVCERCILMSALLDAQSYMLRGRKLRSDPLAAVKAFNRWTTVYDTIFLRGSMYGIVPSDPIKYSDLPPQ